MEITLEQARKKALTIIPQIDEEHEFSKRWSFTFQRGASCWEIVSVLKRT